MTTGNREPGLAFAATGFVHGALAEAGKRALPELEAALARRMVAALAAGTTRPSAAAVAALRACGYPARFEVRGAVGLVTVRHRCD